MAPSGRWRYAVVVLSLVVGACGDGSAPASPGRPMGLSISEPPILRVGQTVQLTATATLAGGGTETVTSAATWESSEPAVVTVSSRGLATAVRMGISTVTASYQGATNSILVYVFVSPPPQGLARASMP